jgi:hypothetical protein
MKNYEDRYIGRNWDAEIHIHSVLGGTAAKMAGGRTGASQHDSPPEQDKEHRMKALKDI